MRKSLATVALAAIAFTATQASAQVAPVGPRVEAIAGYDRIRFDGEKEGGLFLGLGAGYDMPVSSRWSLGGDIEGTYATTEFNDTGFDIKAGRDLYAGLRASYAVSDITNWYFKAGYTNARFKVAGFDSENVEGFRLGTGVQVSIATGAYVGGEYRYSKYDDDLQRHQLAATLGLRFGQPVVAAAPVPVVEAPLPAPAPATQTCLDGTVILATDMCPAPPPPPPPPAPAPAGERG